MPSDFLLSSASALRFFRFCGFFHLSGVVALVFIAALPEASLAVHCLLQAHHHPVHFFADGFFAASASERNWAVVDWGSPHFRNSGLVIAVDWSRLTLFWRNCLFKSSDFTGVGLLLSTQALGFSIELIDFFCKSFFCLPFKPIHQLALPSSFNILSACSCVNLSGLKQSRMRRSKILAQENSSVLGVSQTECLAEISSCAAL